MKSKFGNVKLNSKGYFIVTSGKEGNNGKFLHRLIWEDFYGYEMPEGYVVHHKNGDSADNCILNLQLMRKKEHSRLHRLGKPLSNETQLKLREIFRNRKPYWQGKKRSEETRRKISGALKGNKSPFWKPYARIAKSGFNKQGKQEYCIMKGGKKIKRSINQSKLLEWFKKNYTNEILVLYVGEVKE